MNGFREELNKLILLNRESDSEINRSWGEVYHFLLNRKLMDRYKGEVLTFVDDYETDDEILRCLLIFIKIYGHLEYYEYSAVEQYQDELTSLLLNIDNTLLRIYFQLRENELLFVYHWKKNDVTIARNYAQNIIDNIFNQEKRCFMHAEIAQTYIIEDYDKAIEHAKCALEIALDYKLDYLSQAIENHVIPCISAYNGHYQGITTNDRAEEAHLAIAEGDKGKAINILESLKERTPFQDYYYGLASNDEKLLYRSYKRFLDERNDHFFSKLPYQELIKRGWTEDEKNHHVN